MLRATRIGFGHSRLSSAFRAVYKLQNCGMSVAEWPVDAQDGDVCSMGNRGALRRRDAPCGIGAVEQARPIDAESLVEPVRPVARHRSRDERYDTLRTRLDRGRRRRNDSQDAVDRE